MSFPTKAWRIPFTQQVIQWWGWRQTIGDLADRAGLFNERVPWAIRGRLWNWCWNQSFDWRAQRAKESK